MLAPHKALLGLVALSQIACGAAGRDDIDPAAALAGGKADGNNWMVQPTLHFDEVIAAAIAKPRLLADGLIFPFFVGASAAEPVQIRPAADGTTAACDLRLGLLSPKKKVLAPQSAADRDAAGWTAHTTTPSLGPIEVTETGTYLLTVSTHGRASACPRFTLRLGCAGGACEAVDALAAPKVGAVAGAVLQVQVNPALVATLSEPCMVDDPQTVGFDEGSCPSHERCLEGRCVPAVFGAAQAAAVPPSALAVELWAAGAAQPIAVRRATRLNDGQLRFPFPDDVQDLDALRVVLPGLDTGTTVYAWHHGGPGVPLREIKPLSETGVGLHLRGVDQYRGGGSLGLSLRGVDGRLDRPVLLQTATGLPAQSLGLAYFEIGMMLCSPGEPCDLADGELIALVRYDDASDDATPLVCFRYYWKGPDAPELVAADCRDESASR